MQCFQNCKQKQKCPNYPKIFSAGTTKTGPDYRKSHLSESKLSQSKLSEVKWLERIWFLTGLKKTVPIKESPNYTMSKLSRVNCNYLFSTHIKIWNISRFSKPIRLRKSPAPCDKYLYHRQFMFIHFLYQGS